MVIVAVADPPLLIYMCTRPINDALDEWTTLRNKLARLEFLLTNKKYQELLADPIAMTYQTNNKTKFPQIFAIFWLNDCLTTIILKDH